MIEYYMNKDLCWHYKDMTQWASKAKLLSELESRYANVDKFNTMFEKPNFNFDQLYNKASWSMMPSMVLSDYLAGAGLEPDEVENALNPVNDGDRSYYREVDQIINNFPSKEPDLDVFYFALQKDFPQVVKHYMKYDDVLRMMGLHWQTPPDYEGFTFSDDVGGDDGHTDFAKFLAGLDFPLDKIKGLQSTWETSKQPGAILLRQALDDYVKLGSPEMSDAFLAGITLWLFKNC
jgi:hypothetical protein